MKRVATILALAFIVIVALLIFLFPGPRSAPRAAKSASPEAPEPRITNALQTPARPVNDADLAAAREDVGRLHSQIGNFLLVLKDPYRPPLGDNRDITAALTGNNRRHLAPIATNDPAVRDGQLIDRWGTPYWFHPRAPDAIDVLSAGPDRELFTADDIASEHFQPLEKR